VKEYRGLYNLRQARQLSLKGKRCQQIKCMTWKTCNLLAIGLLLHQAMCAYIVVRRHRYIDDMTKIMTYVGLVCLLVYF